MLGAAVVVTAVLGAGVLASGDSTAQTAAAPKARYWIDASTMSGFGMGGVMSMFGGGNGAQRQLLLRLGSVQAPTGGAAKADHFVPPSLKLGPSVALYTPVPGTGAERPETDSKNPYELRRPKGRLRIYWGCGAHVGPGQPVIFDFQKIAAGQFPPGLFTVNVPVERGPERGNSRTYGEWPNPLDANKNKVLKPNASLLGAHRIAGNYSPEINFTLTQDFMPPMKARSPAGPGGTVNLNWDPVTAATGYYAFAIGGIGQGGQDSLDMVWWTSSSAKEFGGGLQDYLPPATVARLVNQKIIMPPSQTSCMIPAEVKTAAGPMLMTMMTAYGPEQNFEYPPRPANPKTPWRPEWTAKARFKSSTMTITGLDMDAMMNSGRDDAEAPRPACKKKKKGGLGGMLGKAIGSAVGAPSGDDC